MSTVTALTWEQVNSWRVARHYLRERAAPAQLLDMVTQIGGLHAQMLSAAELAAWARVDGLAPGAIGDALWVGRSLVKTWCMRGTLHLLPAREFPLYVAALRTRTSYQAASWLKYHGLTAAEMEALIEAVYIALDGRCLTRERLATAVAEQLSAPRLGELLRSGWGALLKPAAYRGYLCFGPSQGQTVTFVRPDQWLGPWTERDPVQALAELLRLYLRAFGPAKREDFAHWWGVETRQVKQVFGDLAGELAEVDVEGWKGWVLATTLEQLQAPAGPPAVRLLPNFDTYVIGLSPQAGYLIPAGFKPRIHRQAGWVSPVVLIDGRMAGVWEYEKKPARVVVRVDLFAPVAAAIREQITAEAEALSTFLGVPLELVYA